MCEENLPKSFLKVWSGGLWRYQACMGVKTPNPRTHFPPHTGTKLQFFSKSDQLYSIYLTLFLRC